MSELVARTGRHQQRYDDGCRLVAGYSVVFLNNIMCVCVYIYIRAFGYDDLYDCQMVDNDIIS